MKSMITLVLAFSLLGITSQIVAKENYTTVKLNYIEATEAITTLKALTKTPISASVQNNLLVIKGAEKKSKGLIKLIKQMDQPAKPLKLEFIASKRKINFNNSEIIYESGRNINRTSQSMMITERQWVSLNTGLSIPITQRQRASDGTESVTTEYKKITQNYLFKVHEVNGQSIVQVGVDASKLSSSIAGAIQHTQLDTTVVGKTGEWLEVSSSNNLPSPENVITYSTNRSKNNDIHLYIKITKPSK